LNAVRIVTQPSLSSSQNVIRINSFELLLFFQNAHVIATVTSILCILIVEHSDDVDSLLWLQQRESVPLTPLSSVQVLTEEQEGWQEMQANIYCIFHQNSFICYNVMSCLVSVITCK